MRCAGNNIGPFSVQAIAGTHVVLLGMNLPEQQCPGLLGFALRRHDHTEGEVYWLSGDKFAVGAYLSKGAFDRWLAERLTGLNGNVRY